MYKLKAPLHLREQHSGPAAVTGTWVSASLNVRCQMSSLKQRAGGITAGGWTWGSAEVSKTQYLYDSHMMWNHFKRKVSPKKKNFFPSLI